MSKLILVLNCGNTSLKGVVLDSQNGQIVLVCLAERLNQPEASIVFNRSGFKRTIALEERNNHTGAVAELWEELCILGMEGQISAIGHRVVHGGEKYSASVLVDENVIAALEECIPLAPLHNPANVLGIRAAQAIFPNLPNVAVFDTAFHQSIPAHAYTYAVPYELYRQYGLRRYGFHGTNYRYVAQEAASMLGKHIKDTALVIAHLGNGSSVAAVLGGESKDTSMGLTPLEGLVMGTRSGDIDPGVFEFLETATHMNTHEITDVLNKQSGMLGISGLSGDMRTIEKAAEKGHEGAKLALEVSSYRLAKYIAAMCIATGRLDALVFTGINGENASIIRAKTIAYLGILGLKLDEAANEATRFGKAGVITQADTLPCALVVPTNEERMIAIDTLRLAGMAGVS